MASALDLRAPRSALTPALYRVVERHRETNDVVTPGLSLSTASALPFARASSIC